MSKLLVVFAATGQQGGSVIDFVLQDNELAAEFKVRAITRNTASSAAQALQKKGVEVVRADPEQPETLKTAVQGAHTVFSNTPSVYDDKLVEREISSGKAIADASVAAGGQYIIYSSSTPAKKFTGRAVPSFDCKVVVEDYIRTLPIKSAFFAPAAFMQNYHTQQKPRPTDQPGVYAIHSTMHPDSPYPLIDIAADTGKFVGAILTEPEKYTGKSLFATSEMSTMAEAAQIIGKVSGQKVTYVQHPEEVFKHFVPSAMQESICAMLAYFDNPGYYGPETKERVAWTQAQARGKLTTFEEFLTNNPIEFDSDIH